MIYTDTFSRLGDWFHFKDRQPRHLVSGAVYRITCSCQKFYWGETGKCILSRFEEHNKTFGTNLTTVGKHLKSSPTCHINFENNVEVVSKCHFASRRKLIETLYIQESKGDPNLLNEMNKSKEIANKIKVVIIKINLSVINRLPTFFEN